MKICLSRKEDPKNNVIHLMEIWRCLADVSNQLTMNRLIKILLFPNKSKVKPKIAAK